MEIQRCENCATKFNYSDLQKSLWSFSGHKTVKCRNCGAKYRYKVQYIVIFSFLIAIPMIFSKTFIFFLVNLPISFFNRFSALFLIVALSYIVYIVATRALYPFVFKYLEKYED